MTLMLANLPPELNAWGAWLDRVLVGLELAALVAELELVAGTRARQDSLEQICGESLSRVLTSGCAALNPDQLQALWDNPRALLDLQARALAEGGEHWRAVTRDGAHQARIAAGWDRLRDELAARQAPRLSPVAPPAKFSAWSRSVGFLALAAVLLVSLVTWRWTRERSAWGWQRPHAFASDAEGSRYFSHLADLAEQWFWQRPESMDQLRERLNELHQGCDALLAAPHQQLADQDRAWLIERCRRWRDKVDAQLTTLDDSDDVPRARAEADALVRSLVLALRQQADQTAPDARSDQGAALDPALRSRTFVFCRKPC